MKLAHVISMVIVTLIMTGLAAESFRSRKAIAKWVKMLLLTLLLPIAGHIIVALSINEVTARGGYVLFFMGIDLMLYWMIDFCMEYCGYQYEHTKKKQRLRLLLFADVISMWLNPFFFHFFEVEKILLPDGSSYYSRIGHWGYYVHVTFELVMVAIAFFVLIFKIYSTSLIYNEK